MDISNNLESRDGDKSCRAITVEVEAKTISATPGQTATDGRRCRYLENFRKTCDENDAKTS